MDAIDLRERIIEAHNADRAATLNRIRQGKHDQKVAAVLRFLADLEYIDVEGILRDWAVEFDDMEDATTAFELAEMLGRARSLRLGVMADPSCRRCLGYGELREAVDAPSVDCGCVGAR